MSYRIQHKPTGRHLKKTGGSLRFSIRLALGKVAGTGQWQGVHWATTAAVGYLWATKRNAEQILRQLTTEQPDDWEVVEG